MKKTVATLIGALALSSAAAPASARMALWEFVGNWTVYGDSRARACSATVSYQKGIGLAIMFSQNQTDIIVTGVDVFPGKSYRAELWTSNGAHGVLTARAFQSNSVAFEAIDENTIRALVESKQFAIEGLGPFDLNGSRNAMASAWQCFKALNGL